MHHIYNAAVVTCATFLAYHWDMWYPFLLMAFIITQDIKK